MEIASIIFFFVVTYGLGILAAMFAGQSGNFLERNLMRIGIGMGAFITIGLILNLFGIPLDYRIFLAISMASIIYFLFKNKIWNAKLSGIKLTQYDLCTFAVIALFLITFFMYHKGAFLYPYLEDDDSWGHALGVKYVSIEKTVFANKIGLRYIDPYPPGYDMAFGIIHQTNNSVYWTLKFFNDLVISLSIVFFYFFAKLFAGSSKKALFSAFALFAIPSFLSHFIWAIAITMPLFFASFYCIEKIRDDKRWWITSAIVIAATLVTSPTHSAYFAIFLAILLAIRALVDRKFLAYETFAAFSGVALSCALWWIPAVAKHGLKGALSGIGVNVNTTTSILDIAGTADRIYRFRDFFIAQKENMINNPTGIGVALSLLAAIAILALIFKHYREIRKNILKVSLISCVIVAIALLLLSSTYVKYATKKNSPKVDPGSVPFFEFLSEQQLLILPIALMIFLAVSLAIASRKHEDFSEKYLIVVLAWAVFSFFAVNASPYHYKLSPFRAWIILAVPVSFLAGEAINALSSISKPFFRFAPIIAVGLITYGVVMTSFVQKYSVNTSIWPPGGFWTSNEEIYGYIWFKDNLASEAKVFTFSNNALVIGLDKFVCHWCSEVQDYKINGFNKTSEENYNWLKKWHYDYILIDGQAARKFGFNETNLKIQSIANSSKFKPVFNNNGLVIFGVV